MAGKDVEIIIKAKNQAEAAIKAVSASLKDLAEQQASVSASAGKTGTNLTSLGASVARLKAQADNLKSLGDIGVQLDKASSSVDRMKKSLQGNAGELAKLARESDAAATAVDRLKGTLSAEESALAANKAALSQSKKELSDINKLVSDAEKTQARYNDTLTKAGKSPTRGVGKEAGAPQTSARASAGVFVDADLAAARSIQTTAAAQVRQYQEAVDQTSTSIKNLRPQLSAAISQQTALATETNKVASALSSEKTALETGRTELAAVQNVATQASAALGGVAISQESVSAASAKMAAELAAAKARLDGLSNVKTSTSSGPAASTGTADATGIAAQRRATLEAKKAFVEAQAAVKALALEMRATEQPTEALGAAFGRAQATARLAKTEYESQRATLASLGQTAQGSFAAFDRLATSMRSGAASASAAQHEVAGAVREAGSASAEAASKTEGFGASLNRAGDGSRQALSLVQRLRGEILSLTASYIGFNAALNGVGGAVTAYQTLEAVQSRLGAVFNQDTNKVGQEIGFLKSEADRLGISFGVLAEEYGKFSVAASTANFSTAETRKIFTSVSEAARVNRLSVEQTSGVYLALTQMISKGKVSSEELRRQLGDRLTGAFDIFAKAIGVSTAELDKMMQEGEIIANRQTLLSFADELTKRFGPQLSAALQSASTDIGRFQNDIFKAQLTIAGGLIPSLQLALKSFHDFSQSADGAAFFTELGQAAGSLIQIVAEIPKHFTLIKNAVEILIGLKLVSYFTGVIGRMQGFAVSALAARAEMAALATAGQGIVGSQNAITQAFTGAISGINSYRSQLLASTAINAQAAIGVTVVSTALRALTATMAVVGAVAKTMWAAIGGVPGIIAAAITTAIGFWITSIDSASAALTAHDKIVNDVRTAYNNAKGEVADWAKEVQGVSSIQIKIKIDDAQKALDDLKNSIRLPAGATSVDSRRVVQELQAVVESFKSGKTSAVEYKDAINAIAEATPNISRTPLVVQLLETADKAIQAEKVLKDYLGVLETIEKRVTPAVKALLGLNDAVQEASKGFRDEQIKAYTDAIDKLKARIPGLSDELKKLKDITDINKEAWTGMVNAFKAGDFSKIAEIIKLWSQAGAATAAASDAKTADALPGDSVSIRKRIFQLESGGNPNAKSSVPGQSASGLGGFTDSTWLEFFNKAFPELVNKSDEFKLAYKTNTEAMEKVTDAFIKYNQARLADANIPVTGASTYLAHFLGAGDAIKVLKADPNTAVSDVVGARSIAANPKLLGGAGLTTGQLVAQNEKRFGKDITSSGTTKQEDFDQNIELRIKAWKEEAEARVKSNKEGVVAKALAQAEAEATKQGTELSKEQRVAIAEAAAAKYESAHADEELNAKIAEARELLNQIVGLSQQRKTLIEEINLAQNAGDNSKVTELKDRLTGINGQLTELTPKAREFAKALGDEKMTAQLDKVSLSGDKINKQFSLFGLSLDQTKQLAGSFADGAVGAFDSLVEGIVQGKNAFETIRNAFLKFAADFLRQIANMILKQIIMNQISSLFGGGGGAAGAAPMALQGATAAAGAASGGGIGAWFSGLFAAAHTGGLVGATAVGGGNMSRNVPFAAFANAVRYHGGGVAGFRPDEVATVLQKNEEILTTEDPRHRFNGGKRGAQSSAGPSIKQILVMNETELANALNSAPGEQVILTHIKRNAATIKKMVG